MPKTDEELAALVADPEFGTFSPAQRAKILRDATKGRPPLVLQSSADPAPKRPAQPAGRSATDILADVRQAKAARRIDLTQPDKPTVLDELSTLVPGYETTLAPADARARQQRLAQTPLPGTPASITRTARETVTDLVSGGLTGIGLMAPNRAAMEAFDREQRLKSPDLATRMAQQQADRAALMPPLVTQAARNQTASEQVGAMLRGARQMAGDFAEGVTQPVSDLVREPSRLLPTSPGFPEGLVSGALSVPVAMATDPVSDALFGGAGLLAAQAARTYGPALKAAARGAREALNTPAPAQPSLDVPVSALPDANIQQVVPAPAPEAPKPLAATPVLTRSPEVQRLVEQAGVVQKAAPIRQQAPGGRRGSLGTPDRGPGEGWTAAQDFANKQIDATFRRLAAERKQAQLDGNFERMAQIDEDMLALDDARVIVPKSGVEIVTVADLRAQLADAQAAGDAAAEARLTRQIRKTRVSNYYNEAKYAFFSQEERDKFEDTLDRTAATLRAQGIDPKTPVPVSEVIAGAERINPLALEEMGRKGLKRGESLTAVEYKAATEYANRLNAESVAVERRINAIRAAQAGGPDVLDADGNVIARENLPRAEAIETTKLMQLEKDTMGLLAIVTQSRSQKGRDLNYLKSIAQQGFDVSYWLSRAERTSGGVLTGEQSSVLRGIVVDGQQAEAALNAAKEAGDAAAEAAAEETIRQARIRLAKAMSKLTITPWMDAISAARKAGLLSGVKTFARNTTANFLNVNVLEEMVNAVGATPDAFIGMLSGQRAVFVPRVRSIARSYREMGTRGVREALETVVHGMPLDQLAALEVPREVNTPNVALNHYVNYILRFQGAQDRLFKAYALRRSLDDQARALVLNSLDRNAPRPTRAQLEGRIRDLSDNPTNDMLFEAMADAEFATFQNDTAISRMVSGAKQAARRYDAENSVSVGQQLIALWDLFMPFIKTPASIGARVMDYTVGLGAIQALRKRNARVRFARANGVDAPQVLTLAEQKALSKGIARAAIGNTLIWLGSKLYERGEITGTDQMSRREENTAAGRIFSAIKIADQWIPLNPFSPIGNLLTLGASIARDGTDTDGWTRGARAATQVAAVMLDQPFTQGAKQFSDVVKEPGSKTWNRFIGGVAGSYVPSLVAETAQFIDPRDEARAIDYGDGLSAMGQSIQARVPGWRQDLPIAFTGLGNPREANTGWRAFSAGAGSFARENYDPVAREVLITGVDVPRLDQDVQLNRGAAPVKLTLEEQQDLLRWKGVAFNKAVQEALADPEYQAEQSPDLRREWLQRVGARATGAAKKWWVSNQWDQLNERQAQQDAEEVAKRGRGRAVVGPLNTSP